MQGQPSGPLKEHVTTNKDYDAAELTKLIRGIFTGLAMMAFLHGYLGYTQPLFMQASHA